MTSIGEFEYVTDQVNENDWRVVEGKNGRKLYHYAPSNFTTYDKPDHLKTQEELDRDEVLLNGVNSCVSDQFDDLSAGTNSGPVESCTLNNYNIGFQMLKKLGWGEGKGLGKEEAGIVSPIAADPSNSLLGIGKLKELDDTPIEATKERRKHDVEILITESMAQNRAGKAEKLAKQGEDVKSMNQEFYCDICFKQYKNVLEITTHLSSYDHHHKKRFQEMKQTEKNLKRERISETTSNKIISTKFKNYPSLFHFFINS